MKNKELQKLLAAYPDDLEIKILPNHNASTPLMDFTDEQVLFTSKTAFVNDGDPMDEWDCEDGKLELGDGERYLVINPMIY